MHVRNSFNQHNKVRRPGGSHRGAGRKKVMGNDLRHMWQECEPAIGRKIKASYDIRAEDIRRCAAFVTTLPPPSAPESPFFLTLGTPAQQQCPPLNSTLAQRTKEEWARGVGRWGPRYLASKRERGPARVPRSLSEGIVALPVDLFDLDPWKDMVTSYSLAGRLVLSLVTRTCRPVLRGRRATAPSTPWWLGVGVPSPLLGDLNVVE